MAVKDQLISHRYLCRYAAGMRQVIYTPINLIFTTLLYSLASFRNVIPKLYHSLNINLKKKDARQKGEKRKKKGGEGVCGIQQ